MFALYSEDKAHYITSKISNIDTRKKRYSSELTVCFLNNNTVISRPYVSTGMQRKILANILLH